MFVFVCWLEMLATGREAGSVGDSKLYQEQSGDCLAPCSPTGSNPGRKPYFHSNGKSNRNLIICTCDTHIRPAPACVSVPMLLLLLTTLQPPLPQQCHQYLLASDCQNIFAVLFLTRTEILYMFASVYRHYVVLFSRQA